MALHRPTPYSLMALLAMLAMQFCGLAVAKTRSCNLEVAASTRQLSTNESKNFQVGRCYTGLSVNNMP